MVVQHMQTRDDPAGAICVARETRDPRAQHERLGDCPECVLALEMQVGLGQPAPGIAEAAAHERELRESERALGRRLVVVSPDSFNQDLRQLGFERGPVGSRFDPGEAERAEADEARVVAHGDRRATAPGNRTSLGPLASVEQCQRITWLEDAAGVLVERGIVKGGADRPNGPRKILDDRARH